MRIGNNKNADVMENLAVLFHHVSSKHYCFLAKIISLFLS